MEQILAATRAAMLKRGVDAVRVADIAHEASVSTGAVHYHFEVKDEALLAAFSWSANQLFARVEARLAGEMGAAQRLARLLELSLPTDGLMRDEYVIWIQFWARVLNDRSLLPECERISERWRRYFSVVVEDGVAAGEFTPVAPAAEVADRLLALVDGLGFETVIGYRWTSPDRMRELLRRFAEEQLGARLPAP